MFWSTMEWHAASQRHAANLIHWAALSTSQKKQGLEASVSPCRAHDETAPGATKEDDSGLRELCFKSFRTGTPFCSTTMLVAMSLARLP